MTVDCSIDTLLENLGCFSKLDRDKALRQLEADMGQYNQETFRQIENFIKTSLTYREASWELKQGSLAASGIILQKSDTTLLSAEFLTTIEAQALRLLRDDESRVRSEAGSVLGYLCSKLGAAVFQRCRDPVVSMIRDDLHRRVEERKSVDSDKLIEKLIGSHVSDPDGGVEASKIFHESAGWRSLETSMKCLQAMLEGCHASAAPHVDRQLIQFIFESLNHGNRFVRETGYYLCGALALCLLDSGDDSSSNPLKEATMSFAEYLAKGLADNWSQVRLAASVASRQFLMTISESNREKYLELLLPPMCLNRYYLAEGVRLYNQETWRLVMGDQGRALVARFISPVVRYYIAQTEADNHAVREAACHSIAELAAKIDHAAVEDHVAALLSALIVCFEDESWPVRDAACVACGNFIACYPTQSRDDLEKLWPMFFGNLSDCIPSVRHGAAEAIAKVVNIYGEEAALIVMPKLKEGLRKIEDQPDQTEKFGDLETGLTNFGVARQKYAMDDDLHTDQTMYSCGSLAPKMGRGGAGCSDCKFRRPPAPWEETDGCVHLLTELCIACKFLHGKLANLLPVMAQATSKRTFPQHVQLLESICHCVVKIGRALDKRYFRSMLDEFWDGIFYGLDCECQLTEVAACDCLRDLAILLGPNILRGRIENVNPKYLEKFDSFVPAR